MELHVSNCPNCNAKLDLTLESQTKTAKCTYCDSEFLIKQDDGVVAEDSKISNLLELISVAEKAGNYRDALGYYNKILEIDSNNYSAWFGKGVAIGFLTTVNDFKLNETIACMATAIQKAPESKREELEVNTANFLNNVGMGTSKLAADHLNSSVTGETHQKFVFMMGVVSNCYKIALAKRPNDLNILLNLAETYKAIMKKYTNKQSGQEFHLSKDSYEEAKKMLQETIKKINAIDPKIKVEIPPFNEGLFGRLFK